jgi:hypothetical protein
MTIGGDAKPAAPSSGPLDFASSDSLEEGADEHQATPGVGVRGGAAGSSLSMVADSPLER